MHPEKVLAMCTEKSVDIKDMPGGGVPEFTTEDARHALAHMKEAEFNYCQYVFLLYPEKLDALTENTVLHIVKTHPEVEYKKDYKLFMELCRMACVEQTRPAGKITQVARYTHLKLSRHEWRYQWEFIFAYAVRYLNELQEGVKRHIFLRTRTEN